MKRVEEVDLNVKLLDNFFCLIFFPNSLIQAFKHELLLNKHYVFNRNQVCLSKWWILCYIPWQFLMCMS